MRDLPAIIELYGLDKPFLVQYGTWLGQVFRGNLGWSSVVSMPVGEAIWHYLPATLELAIFAAPLIILTGHLLRYQGRRPQRQAH